MEFSYRSGHLSTVIEFPLLEGSSSSSQPQTSATVRQIPSTPPRRTPPHPEAENEENPTQPQQDAARLAPARRVSTFRDFGPHISPIPVIDEDIWVYCSPDSSRGPSPSPAAISLENFAVDEGKQADQVTQHINSILNRLVAEGIVRQGAPEPAPELVDTLPDFDIQSAYVEAEEGCPICQDPFDDEKIVKQLPCKHLYHRECIAMWFERHASCPLCRLRLQVGNADDEMFYQAGINSEMLQEDASARFERFHGRRARFGFLRRTSSRSRSPTRSSPGSRRGSRRRSFLSDKIRDIYPRVEALERQDEDQRKSNLRRRGRESISRTLFGRRGHVSPVGSRSGPLASRPRTASLPASTEGKTTFSRFRPRGLSSFMKRKSSDIHRYRAVVDESENKESYSVSLSGSCSPNLDRARSHSTSKHVSNKHVSSKHVSRRRKRHSLSAASRHSSSKKGLFDDEKPKVRRSVSFQEPSRSHVATPRASLGAIDFDARFRRSSFTDTLDFGPFAYYDSSPSTPQHCPSAGRTPPPPMLLSSFSSHPVRRTVAGVEIPSFTSDCLERMSSTQLEKLAAAYEAETHNIRTELWKRRKYAEENLCLSCRLFKPGLINLPCRHLGMCRDCYADVQRHGVASFSDTFVSFSCRRCRESVINVLEIEVDAHPNIAHRRTPFVGTYLSDDPF